MITNARMRTACLKSYETFLYFPYRLHYLTPALGRTDACCYSAGENAFNFFVDTIDVSQVEPSALTNAGLLTATLQCGGDELVSLNMVVQVQQKDGDFVRLVYNPLVGGDYD